MNLLYKSVEADIGVSFSEKYLYFSNDEETSFRYKASRSLHEAFKLVEDEDDMTNLKDVFHNFIYDKRLTASMNANLGVYINHYCNKCSM